MELCTPSRGLGGGHCPRSSRRRGVGCDMEERAECEPAGADEEAVGVLRKDHPFK